MDIYASLIGRLPALNEKGSLILLAQIIGIENQLIMTKKFEAIINAHIFGLYRQTRQKRYRL